MSGRLQVPLGIEPGRGSGVAGEAAVRLAEPFDDGAVTVAQKQVVATVAVEIARTRHGPRRMQPARRRSVGGKAPVGLPEPLGF